MEEQRETVRTDTVSFQSSLERERWEGAVLWSSPERSVWLMLVPVSQSLAGDERQEVRAELHTSQVQAGRPY